jgi:hypothetical protein
LIIILLTFHVLSSFIEAEAEVVKEKEEKRVSKLPKPKVRKPVVFAAPKRELSKRSRAPTQKVIDSVMSWF